MTFQAYEILFAQNYLKTYNITL